MHQNRLVSDKIAHHTAMSNSAVLTLSFLFYLVSLFSPLSLLCKIHSSSSTSNKRSASPERVSRSFRSPVPRRISWQKRGVSKSQLRMSFCLLLPSTLRRSHSTACAVRIPQFRYIPLRQHISHLVAAVLCVHNVR